MAITKYNGVDLVNGINDNIATLNTTKSGTYIDNMKKNLQDLIDAVKNSFDGIMSTTLTPQDPLQTDLIIAINNYVINTKGSSASIGNTVILINQLKYIYGRVVFNGTSWQWDYKIPNMI